MDIWRIDIKTRATCSEFQVWARYDVKISGIVLLRTELNKWEKFGVEALKGGKDVIAKIKCVVEGYEHGC